MLGIKEDEDEDEAPGGRDFRRRLREGPWRGRGAERGAGNFAGDLAAVQGNYSDAKSGSAMTSKSRGSCG